MNGVQISILRHLDLSFRFLSNIVRCGKEKNSLHRKSKLNFRPTAGTSLPVQAKLFYAARLFRNGLFFITLRKQKSRDLVTGERAENGNSLACNSWDAASIVSIPSCFQP